MHIAVVGIKGWAEANADAWRDRYDGSAMSSVTNTGPIVGEKSSIRTLQILPSTLLTELSVVTVTWIGTGRGNT